MSSFIFKNGKIVLVDSVLEGYCVKVEGKSIDKIFKDEGKYEGDVIDANGFFISPGFIDIHVHGGGEGDFLDGGCTDIKNIINMHTKHGTTGIYPTTLACEDNEIFKALDVIEEYKNKDYCEAEILGVHLEGPYFNLSERGAQDSKYIKCPKREEYNKIFDYSSLIRRVTFAPEIEGGRELSEEIKRRGLVGSIGHSDAEYNDIVRALGFGIKHVNHLYSGMQGIHRINGYRKLGIVECAYLFDQMTVEIIADGCHLPIELLNMIYKIKGPDRIALITDAMRSAGRESGESILGSKSFGQRVILKDGVAFMPDFKAFAGSIATFDRLVFNMYNKVGVEIFNVIKMAALTPAKIMGCDERKGSISPGKDADIIIFDEKVNVKYVMVRGEEYLNIL